jgi:pimeloyl-ACP methyl ester carboxylesterase
MAADRFGVRSADGTPLAVWVDGHGPPLLLAGADSRPVLKEATDRALAAIPGARAQVLEGHAHLAYRSDPAMVAAVVRQLVSGSAAASGARPGVGTRPG